LAQAPIYDVKSCSPAQFFMRCCLNPVCASPQTLDHNAVADGLFVVSSECVLTFSLLQSFDDTMLSRLRTFTAFVADQTQAYSRAGQTFLTRPYFTNVWWLWNSLRDLDHSAAFKCRLCAALPPSKQICIIDGVTLGFRKEQFPVFQEAKTSGVEFVGRCVHAPQCVFLWLMDCLVAFTMVHSVRPPSGC